MAVITPALLQALSTGFKKDFQSALGETTSDFEKIATTINSTAASNIYGWLGQMPGFREWIGERVIKAMKAHGYTITNKKFEMSVGVSREDIEDDNIGIYSPMMSEMGRASKAQPDELVFSLLKAADSIACYDGQYFFDNDHPIYANNDGTGTASTISNITAGSGAAWYLLDCSRSIKPIIFQSRTKPELTAMTKNEDESVFMSDEYRYGVRVRNNVGFGFWQMAHKCNAPLDKNNFSDAKTAMRMIKTDGGRPLNIKADTLLVPASLEDAARELIDAERTASGATNIHKSAVKQVIVSPWLD